MIVTDKELDDYLVSQNWTRNDLTEEQLSSLRQNMEWVKNGGAILPDFGNASPKILFQVE